MLKNLVLVFNCGSSSVKFSILDPIHNKKYLFGIVERLYLNESCVTWHVHKKKKTVLIGNNVSHNQALKFIIKVIFTKYDDLISSIQYIGHRVVHGGNQLIKSVIINDTIIQKIQENSVFAPLHNPMNILGIQASIQYFPDLKKKNVAVLDTSFYHSLPDFSYLYAIPYKFYKKYHIRRYGAHGISHLYIAHKTSDLLNIKFNNLNIITCHLGGGSSITAIRNGLCIDTSMGLTPLEGLVMGTRSGDIDPSVVFFMYDILGKSMDEIQHILINKSGILGLTNGLTSDFRYIEEKYYSKFQAYRIMNLFCYRLSKYIGSYAASLEGKLDAIVFTGGIGENSALTRALVLSRLEFLGLKIDNNLNYQPNLNKSRFINKKNTIPLLVIPTNEEFIIAKETIQLFL
ncbi:Acetate kinase [Buchnera aphidicola (Takecallis arundicolens)]|uniref:acetate kinase n=1 Tax=Buchnera aphidicola TaxID=9 RepID=UPI0034638BD9